MTGFHNVSMYTLEDNDYCPRCANGELMFNERTLTGGGVSCPVGKAVPSKKGCNEFVQASDVVLQNRESMLKFMLGFLPFKLKKE
jgi:hypothetical protein